MHTSARKVPASIFKGTPIYSEDVESIGILRWDGQKPGWLIRIEYKDGKEVQMISDGPSLFHAFQCIKMQLDYHHRQKVGIPKPRISNG